MCIPTPIPLVRGTLAQVARCVALGAALAVFAAARTHAQPTATPEPRRPAAGQTPQLGHLASGPAFILEQYTVEDGLPVNAVNDIAQTADGYVWLATTDGLVRFDGVRFTVFRTSNRPELSSNRIHTLMVDGGGVLWVFESYGSIVRYAAGTFARVTRSDGRPVLKTATPAALDPDGHVWIQTDRGLLRTAGSGRLVPASVGMAARSVQSLYWEADGTLWIGATSGVYRNRHHGGLTLALREAATESAFWRGPEGVLLFRGLDRTGQSVMRRIEGTGPDGAWPRVGQSFRDEQWSTDEAGHVWTLPTPTRLQRDGQTVLDTAEPIFILMHDREGNTWVSAGDGVYRLRPSSLQVVGRPEGVFTNSLYSVVRVRSGAVWLGSYAPGLTRLAGRQATTYAVPTHLARAFHQDRSGALWVGGDGVCRIEDPERGAACRSDDMAPGLRAGVDVAYDPVEAIHEDRAGRVWVGGLNALHVRPAGCRSSACWRTVGRRGDQQAGVRVIHEQADGTLWMGTRGRGVYQVAGGRLDTLSVADGLPSGQIRSIYEDPTGVLWIGTEDAGLVRLDPRGTRDLRAMPLTRIREADGLFADGIHQILPDDDGHLWMNTNHGVFWVEREALEAFHRGEVPRIRSISYTERDGMRNREGNGGSQPAGTRDTQGRLWFPTQNGVAVFDPAEMVTNAPPPPVLIEQLTAGGERVPTHVGRASIALGAATRDVEIEYTAPSFIDPENLRFGYRLEGFDADWVEAGTRRTAFYTNLPPGRYDFRVRVQSASGAWSTPSAALTLTVAPFFYETGWFLALCLIGVGLVAGGGYRARVRQLKQREIDLGAVVEERTEALRAEKATTEAQAAQLLELDVAKSRFFANVSHEFRTPLTLTLGPLEDLRAGVHGPQSAGAVHQLDLALRNSRRLLRLVGQLLDVARLESGTIQLHLQRGDLAAYVRTLSQPFVAAAERNRVGFTVETPAAPVWVRLDVDQLDKVVVNLLSNALKFTPAGGTVALTVQRDGRHALVAVRDTGSGIAPELQARLFERFVQGEKSEMQPGTGIGLALARNLAELHAGTIHVESEVGVGSVFTLRMPLAEPPEDDAVVEAPGMTTRVGALPDLQPDAAQATSDLPDARLDDDRTTVLVVDDNADIRAYLRSHLQRDPRYRVVEAEDGEAALAAVRQRLPDLVVSDVMMPRLDGFGLLGALRADPETDFVPVVLLTARAEAEDRLAGLGLGADDYVTKPFDAVELTQRIDNLIAMRRRLRERYAGLPAPPAAGSGERAGSPRSSADRAFLDAVEAATAARLPDETFDVNALAEAVAQSRSNLHKRLTELLCESPSGYVRRRRLERGADLLRQRVGTVSEVAYAVGFKSVSHFSSSFSRHYGQTPTAWITQHAAHERTGEAAPGEAPRAAE